MPKSSRPPPAKRRRITRNSTVISSPTAVPTSTVTRSRNGRDVANPTATQTKRVTRSKAAGDGRSQRPAQIMRSMIEDSAQGNYWQKILLET